MNQINLEKDLKIIKESANLSTTWAVGGIGGKEMNNLFSKNPVLSLSYGGLTTNFTEIDNPMTWLDIWEAANYLVIKNGNINSIRSIETVTPGHYRVV